MEEVVEGYNVLKFRDRTVDAAVKQLHITTRNSQEVF